MQEIHSKNPDFKEYVRSKIDLNKFMHYIDFKITDIEVGRIKGYLDFKEIHHQQNGILHGGVTSSLCDMAGGFAAYSVVAPDEMVFTVEIKVTYFHPGQSERFYVTGEVVKAGKQFCFCESVVRNTEQKIIAKSTMTMAVRKK
ncbi:MAG: PaaI family thioesterase [Chitinophagaceae bacterium]|nr:MAG: PaaI family thioesterase [Chitinophagaceae bacterium]